MTDENGYVLYDDVGNVLPERFILPVVYVIEAVGLDRVKIGYTEELIRRFKEIRTSCPVRIRLVGFVKGDRALEAWSHRLYKDRRREGEWFHVSQREIDAWRAEMGSGVAGRSMYEDFRSTCVGNGDVIPWRPMPKEIETFEEVYADLMEEVAEEFANV